MLIEHKATVLQINPSMLRMIIEERAIGKCFLRHVFCGGEALTVELRDRFLERLDAKLLVS